MIKYKFQLQLWDGVWFMKVSNHDTISEALHASKDFLVTRIVPFVDYSHGFYIID